MNTLQISLSSYLHPINRVRYLLPARYSVEPLRFCWPVLSSRVFWWTRFTHSDRFLCLSWLDFLECFERAM